jgi:hypothetical protein
MKLKVCLQLQPVLYASFTHFYKGVGRQAAHEMSILRSWRKGELSGGTGSNVLVEEVERGAQAGSSTRSQAQAPKEGPPNSGKNTSYYFSSGSGI